MNGLQAAKVALKEAGKPLHYKEITQLMLDRGLWQTDGKTPDATINATIAVDIKQYGTHSLFQRTDKGVYALRAWGLPEFHTPSESADVEDDTQQMEPDVSTIKSFSFTDAADQVLKQFSGEKPMHYRDITKKARALSPEQREAIFKRDGRRCRLCGAPATDIDHIAGSSSDPENLQALCKPCNMAKARANFRSATPEEAAEGNAIWARIRAERPVRLCDDEKKWDELWRDRE